MFKSLHTFSTPLRKTSIIVHTWSNYLSDKKDLLDFRSNRFLATEILDLKLTESQRIQRQFGRVHVGLAAV